MQLVSQKMFLLDYPASTVVGARPLNPTRRQNNCQKAHAVLDAITFLTAMSPKSAIFKHHFRPFQ